MVPVIILVAPSGGGKSSILKELRQKKRCAFSVSVTTRLPRPNEVHGYDYYFLSKEQFAEYEKSNRFLETTNVCGQFYGTLISEIERLMSQHLPIVLELDTKGAEAARQHFSNSQVVLLIPPSFQILSMRLQLRGTEELSELNQRLKIASDVVRWGVNHADYLIVNDQIEAALSDFEAILHSECLRKRYSFEKNHKILEDFTSI